MQQREAPRKAATLNSEKETPLNDVKLVVTFFLLAAVDYGDSEQGTLSDRASMAREEIGKREAATPSELFINAIDVASVRRGNSD
jgi:hypothetical protein